MAPSGFDFANCGHYTGRRARRFQVTRLNSDCRPQGKGVSLAHQSVLAYAHYRYLKLAAVVTLIVVGAYVYDRPPNGRYGGGRARLPPRPPRGAPDALGSLVRGA